LIICFDSACEISDRHFVLALDGFSTADIRGNHDQTFEEDWKDLEIRRGSV
jgi:hypothetical protein